MGGESKVLIEVLAKQTFFTTWKIIRHYQQNFIRYTIIQKEETKYKLIFMESG